MTTNEGPIYKFETALNHQIKNTICQKLNDMFINQKFTKKIIDTVYEKFESSLFKESSAILIKNLNPTNYKKEIEQALLDIVEKNKTKIQSMKQKSSQACKLRTTQGFDSIVAVGGKNITRRNRRGLRRKTLRY